jgi:hypothetical protein
MRRGLVLPVRVRRPGLVPMRRLGGTVHVAVLPVRARVVHHRVQHRRHD